MEFHSKLLQPLPDQRVRGWNGPLPFYMAYPGYFGPGQEAALVQDLDYLQQTYPAQVLSRVGDILKSYSGKLIKIEGHTDNVPISSAAYPSNLWLSTARATKVLEYLQNVKGLKPKNLEASGRGESIPVASNSTASGRARNRRVEIKIYSNTH